MAKVTVNLRGADKINQMLRDLPKHLTQGKTGGIAAKSLRKGGRVLVKEEKKTLRAAIEAGTNYSTGTLEKKLTVKRVKYDGKGERMNVTVRKGNYKTAPNGTERTGKKSRPTFYAVGLFLEYGTSKQPAVPWVRPALTSKGKEAIETVNDDLIKQLDKVAQKMLPKVK